MDIEVWQHTTHLQPHRVIPRDPPLKSSWNVYYNIDITFTAQMTLNMGVYLFVSVPVDNSYPLMSSEISEIDFGRVNP